MERILEILDAAANVATVLSLILALIEGYIRYRMGREKK